VRARRRHRRPDPGILIAMLPVRPPLARRTPWRPVRGRAPGKPDPGKPDPPL